MALEIDGKAEVNSYEHRVLQVLEEMTFCVVSHKLVKKLKLKVSQVLFQGIQITELFVAVFQEIPKIN